MCVLCNPDSLRLLVSPQDSLSYPDLCEAIRVAREAAIQLALDSADELEDLGGADAALGSIGPESYLSYVVDRAERDGVADPDEIRAWNSAHENGTILLDPRVQAFLSSATEGLAAYLAQIHEKQLVLERFLEIGPGTAIFGGIGPYGEICFEYGEEKCILLSDDEAMQIAVDHISGNLWSEDPALLLRYTSLPDDAVDILAAAQKRPQDEANRVLGGIVDVAALAEDAVRQGGYGRFVANGHADDFTEQRFGDFCVIRLRLTDAPHDET